MKIYIAQEPVHQGLRAKKQKKRAGKANIQKIKLNWELVKKRRTKEKSVEKQKKTKDI